MKDIIEKYINSISAKFSYVETSEIGYRYDFQSMLESIFDSINVRRFDHDARAKQGNKPDFVVRKGDIPILYIETKDIGISLDKVERSEQMSRYFGYTNLVLTDYLEFRFYRNGIPYGEPIKIGEYNLKNREITPNISNYEYLAKTLLEFTQSHKEPIKSGKHLSKIMGGKAQRIRDNVRQFLKVKSEKNTELLRVYETIKKLLVHDLTEESFSDMYAQTLVYGLFVARFYDDSPSNFTRQEARDLIPSSNPLLRHFFDHIVGPNFDKRLEYIVNELCEVFSHANIENLMNEYLDINLKGKTSKIQDTVIHFYEDFLNEYDPELRKKMGAYYTPLPVVEFIVRSVDELLKKEFNLLNGLADTSKLQDGRHKVQILDPAVGTGTFISTIINEIYKKFAVGQEGRWTSYVHNDLLPRLHGFELMMAPYTITHLKLAMAFKTTGFKYFNKRLGIYLTNSLEQVPAQEDLFTAFGLAESIAEESKEAAKIKSNTPVMVVIGNPPYSGVSSNETEYANSLVARYKVEPGGKQKLQERKHWLNDDYVKFIALAESMIEKTGDGILAMITNNGYLDNPTFRGMRWHLAKTFDKIYVLDLHGNVKKKEISPDGSIDENVFDIQQGVGIILAIKTGKKEFGELGDVYHADLYGTRKYKFDELTKTPNWSRVKLNPKMLYFSPKSLKGQERYEKGFKLNELFIESTTGIVTMGDKFIINEKKEVIESNIHGLITGEYTKSILNEKFNLGKNYADFIISNKSKLYFDEKKIVKICYRPFDTRWTYFDNKVIWRWRENIMKHYLAGDNVGLLFTRMTKGKDFTHIWITDRISEVIYLSPITATNAFNAPLYMYDENGIQKPNLNKEIIEKIEMIVGSISPENILDYIYAVLHSPSYRKKYNEFLKIDFPRVSYPNDKDSFKELVRFGRKLRELHLFEFPGLNKFITTYPVGGSDRIEKVIYKDKKVLVNDEQYFGNVPEAAWDFWIGGYQPAQKWLKDRKGRSLTNEDIEHYQKIITVLTETDKVMKEIDRISLI